MERAVELFAAISFLGIGLSHVLHPQAWVEFFAWLRAKGRAGMFAEGLLALAFGAFVVAFHNVWSGLPLVLTLVGWGQLLKGVIRLTAPRFSLRVYETVTPDRAWRFQAGGAFALALSALLAYVALLR